MFNLTEFLTGLPLSDGDKSTLSTLFSSNPDAVKAVETRLQSEIDAGIGTARAEVDSKRAELEAEWNALSSYRGADAKTVEALEKNLEIAQSKLAVAVTRLESTAKRAGLDPETVLKDVREAAPVVTKPAAAIDSPLNADQLMQQAGALSWNAVVMNGQIMDIQREHRELFGTELPSVEGLLKTLTAEARRLNNRNLTPREVWEAQFKVPEKRQEIAEARIVARVEAGKKEAVEAYKSEQALRVSQQAPPSDPNAPPSPVFAALRDTTKPVAVQGMSESVSAAILDFRKRMNPAA